MWEFPALAGVALPRGDAQSEQDGALHGAIQQERAQDTTEGMRGAPARMESRTAGAAPRGRRQQSIHSMAVCHPEHSGPPAARLGQPGMLWDILLTAQEGTDQNLRAASVYKQKGGPAEENKGQSIPDSGKLSMAPQPAKFSTPDQAKEPQTQQKWS